MIPLTTNLLYILLLIYQYAFKNVQFNVVGFNITILRCTFNYLKATIKQPISKYKGLLAKLLID